MKRLIFFGTQDWAAVLLEHLIQDDFFEIALVVTQPDQQLGRKKVLTPSPVKQIALRHNLPVAQPMKLRDPVFLDQLESLNADFFLVIAYGRLLPEEIISLPAFGTINVHPSMLPKWRGPSPVQAAIAHGDMVSGVTIMKIDSKMDHGPILAQKEIPIDEAETFETFMKKVVALGKPLLSETLKRYLSVSLTPVQQDHTQATICKLLTREDGHIDWNRSACEIERMIRAYHPWPGTWSELIVRGKPTRLKILKANLSDHRSSAALGTLFASENRLYINTNNGTLEITLLQPEGKPPMTASAFLSGYVQMLGGVLQ